MSMGVYTSFPNSLYLGIGKSSENLVIGERAVPRAGSEQSERPVPLSSARATVTGATSVSVMVATLNDSFGSGQGLLLSSATRYLISSRHVEFHIRDLLSIGGVP